MTTTMANGATQQQQRRHWQNDEFFSQQHDDRTLFSASASRSHAANHHHHRDYSSSTNPHPHHHYDSMNHHHHHHHHHRNNQSQQSSSSLLLGTMEGPYNGTPLSWFQRYYYHNYGAAGGGGIFQPRRRDELYMSSGSLTSLMENNDDDYDDDHNNATPQPFWADCCQVLCGALCCMLGCGCCCYRNKQKQQYQVTTMAANGEHNNGDSSSSPQLQRSASFSRYKAISGFCLVLFLTIFLPMTLLHASRGDGTWILHAGESHRIVPAFLNHGITVTCTSTGAEKLLNVQVYAANGACPPLTGPPRNVSHSENLTLTPETFEYHFFYMNEGSNVTAQVATSVGVVNVYLLQGPHALRQVERSSFDPANSQYVKKKTVHPGQVVELNESINTTDTYILLYDNDAKTSNATLSVFYELVMSTYDWQDKPPTCSHAEEGPCTVSVALFPPWQKQCLFVQTTLPTLDEKDETTHGHPVFVPADMLATVHITQHRRFGWIVAISLLPLFMYSFWPRCHEEEQDTPQARPSSYDELYRAAFPVVLHDAPLQNFSQAQFPEESGRGFLANVTNNYPEALSAHSYQHSSFK